MRKIAAAPAKTRVAALGFRNQPSAITCHSPGCYGLKTDFAPSVRANAAWRATTRPAGLIAKCFDRRIDRSIKWLLPPIVSIDSLIITIALSGWPRSVAAEQPSDVPAWLKAHVGEGKVKSQSWSCRGRAPSTCKKLNEGTIKNSCYFAMDATRPAGFGRRFYVTAKPTVFARFLGHGSGRNVPGANFTNGISCAKNFSNAIDSKLTTGGPYVTAETEPLQRVLSLGGKIRCLQPLVRAVRWRRRHRKCETARHRRTSGRRIAGGLSAKRSGQSVREQRRLRSVWEARGLRRRPQQWLHQLVAGDAAKIIPMMQ